METMTDYLALLDKLVSEYRQGLLTDFELVIRSIHLAADAMEIVEPDKPWPGE